MFEFPGLTFRIPHGSFVAVCGKNGVGKSTLFKLLLRLYDVDEGSIVLGGRNIKVCSEHTNHVNMPCFVPNAVGLVPSKHMRGV